MPYVSHMPRTQGLPSVLGWPHHTPYTAPAIAVLAALELANPGPGRGLETTPALGPAAERGLGLPALGPVAVASGCASLAAASVGSSDAVAPS